MKKVFTILFLLSLTGMTSAQGPKKNVPMSNKQAKPAQRKYKILVENEKKARTIH